MIITFNYTNNKSTININNTNIKTILFYIIMSIDINI